MSFLFLEYNDAQRKQRINAKMIYTSFLQTLQTYNLSYRYKMIWQKQANGEEVLAKVHLKSQKREYLGKKNEQTLHIRQEFEKQKASIKEKLDILKEKLKREEKLNKVEGVTRAPKELVALFRKINELGLDTKVIAIGTNSLYAYEARCGVIIEQEHLATYDIDLLNKKDKGISFIFHELMNSKKAEEFLQNIDPSFVKNPLIPYRFENKSGVWVELINPFSDSVKEESFKENLFFDVMPLSMRGIQWLENARLFSEMIIGDDGKCAFIHAVHPIEYAVYKNWLSKQEDRDYEKYSRDLQQSKLVTQLMQEYMPNIDLKEEASALKHFKKEIVQEYLQELL